MKTLELIISRAERSRQLGYKTSKTRIEVDPGPLLEELKRLGWEATYKDGKVTCNI